MKDERLNIIVIPARYDSTRLPGKPLRRIGGKTLIQWVYEKALTSKLKDEVIIATDDKRIERVACSFGAEAVLTSPQCQSGTDRVYEALKDKKADIIINLQGDEPMIRGDMIDMLFSVMKKEKVDIATLCSPLRTKKEYRDPNTVKVVLDSKEYALYFSRSPIPYVKVSEQWSVVSGKNFIYKHVGIYAYTMSFLETFVSLKKGKIEEAESLEQLRALENGYRIRVLITEYDGFGIDTEEDLKRAEGRIQ